MFRRWGSAVLMAGIGLTGLATDRGKGVAQEHSFLASTNTSMLPPTIGARTVSVCDAGDQVCDYDPDATRRPPAVRTPGARRCTTS